MFYTHLCSCSCLQPDTQFYFLYYFSMPCWILTMLSSQIVISTSIAFFSTTGIEQNTSHFHRIKWKKKVHIYVSISFFNNNNHNSVVGLIRFFSRFFLLFLASFCLASIWLPFRYHTLLKAAPFSFAHNYIRKPIKFTRTFVWAVKKIRFVLYTVVIVNIEHTKHIASK